MKRLIAKPDGNHEIIDVPEVEAAEILAEKEERQKRLQVEENKEQSQGILDSTDWTQIPNNGLTEDCVVAFKEYRDAIRVIRQSDASEVEWPVKPQLEWS